MTNREHVLALYRAIESGSPLNRARFTDDAETIERPNLIKPRGARSPLADMIENSVAGSGLLSSQRYDVASLIEIDDLVIARLTWTGVIARTVGPFRDGQQLTAHIAQFVTVRDGLISRIETFDCYEPFA